MFPKYDPQAVTCSFGLYQQQHSGMDKEIKDPTATNTKEIGHLLRLINKLM